ncbi:MAG TPA: hypothetical protein VMV44_08920 [Rectinemataceae bacterium]|nr:hypothetical protein [Rectinemataceae bacterium]
MPVKRDYGLALDRSSTEGHERLISYINIKLASLGLPLYSREGTSFVELAADTLENLREKNHLLGDRLPPADRRIQAFLDSYLEELGGETIPRLPSNTFILDRYGMGRELSLPPDAHRHVSPTLSSWRVKNGVLHNPTNDRRTTEGVFHVATGGLPIPPDKKAVPKIAYARLLQMALSPPDELLALPFTATGQEKAHCFLSLLIRPPVCPEVPSYSVERSMELRLFAPGSLAASLDFIESIFGNSGDPWVPENDAALSPLSWTGHTGCIILATHLVGAKKKDLGLPRWDEATERERRDGMAWKEEGELYNGGKPFKLTARDERGVVVSIIADNYFGYAKKEVKTQISYSANLLGLAEEEHAGGALVFPAYSLGTRFVPDHYIRLEGHSIGRVREIMGGEIDWKPFGYGLDRRFADIVYLPEDATISLDDQRARWTVDGEARSIRVIPGEVYVHPSGYQVQMDRHPGTGAWRLIGKGAEGLFAHKPCTVSGGGKSEISKSIADAISYYPLITGDFEADMAMVKAIIDGDYSHRFKDQAGGQPDHRPILSPERSLGSVIKLLSPSSLYTDEHNAWLRSIPERIKAFVFLIKRFWRREWGEDWASHFSVDAVNGAPGNIIKFEGRVVQGSYLRVGRDASGKQRNFKLRQDFMPAVKLQREDDISASVVVPAKNLEGLPWWADRELSLKFVRNCEARFFQRPDDAVIRGYDKKAEEDLARSDNFISNFDPLSRQKAKRMIEKSVSFSEYTAPMRAFIEGAAADPDCQWFVASDKLRIVDGLPTKNPRFLQLDPSLVEHRSKRLAEIGTRLYRGIASGRPLLDPVNSVLPGRRNNPAEPGSATQGAIRPLAVYGPIHWQELPELFMDFICSLTGKSPSTTGAGSEGALTKGPFNALVPTTDLNNALLSFILTGYEGFTTAAGHVGRAFKVDHDISLLVPELWSRLEPKERDPRAMLKAGYLEKVVDFDYEGRRIPASRLGYRITALFASTYLGRIFDTPASVFPDELLRPELQSMADFVDGVENIAEAQVKAARNYLADGSADRGAIPPIRALLHIMAEGSFEGRGIEDPEIRRLFTREYVLSSPWYAARLDAYVQREMAFLASAIAGQKAFLSDRGDDQGSTVRYVRENLEMAEAKLERVSTPAFRAGLVGTIGLDPLFRG